MTGELRPIGSEFECCFEPSRNGNRCVFRVWTYRVVGHSKAQDRGGLNEGFEFDKSYPIGEPYMVERLEPVGVVEHAPLFHWQLGSQSIPVPPKEIRHLLRGWELFRDA